MKNKFILSLILLFVVNTVSAQKKFTKEQLIADADSLYTTLSTIHPDLFFVLPQSEFEQELDRIKAQFDDSMTALDFYRKIYPLVVRLGDGHTSMYMPSFALNWENQKVAFPLEIVMDKKDNSVIIKDDYSQSGIVFPEGSKILSINGREMKDILNDLLRYVSGESYSFKFARVLYDFYLMYYILYDEHTQFTVTYQSADEKKTVTVEALTLKQYFDTKEKRNKEEEQPVVWQPYTLTIDNDNSTAIIDFLSFYDPDRFTVFLDSTFTLIKEQNIKNLIIDVRQNGGGDAIMNNELFQYISPVAFQQFGPGKEVASHKGNPWDGPLIELRENDKRFTGNCYVLISNNTYSAASNMAWVIQYLKMGKIIGEETGGYIVSFGHYIWCTLPNTRIRYDVSRLKFYGYGSDDSHRHGVRPDYEVPADDAMDYTLKLIKKNK